MSRLSQDPEKKVLSLGRPRREFLVVEIEAGFRQGIDETNSFLGCRVSAIWEIVLGV